MGKFKFYYYNYKKLKIEEINKKYLFTFGGWILILLLLFLLLGIKIGSSFHKNKVISKSYNNNLITKESTHPTKNKEWIDSTFKDYTLRAKLYLNKPFFKESPIKPEILTLCARNAYDSTAILLPVELALAQAQWESSMGLEGKSPKNNPYNIGETDNGTVRYFKSTFDGIQAYYYVMCNNYLSCRKTEELLVNFVNCNGRRYASSETYETNMYNLYISIKNWLDSRIKD
jgi:uncharacterized membrane protein